MKPPMYSSDIVCCLVSYFYLFIFTVWGFVLLWHKYIWRPEVKGQLAKVSGFLPPWGGISSSCLLGLVQALCPLSPGLALWPIISIAELAFSDLFKTPASNLWLRMRWFSFWQGLHWVRHWGCAHQMSRGYLLLGPFRTLKPWQTLRAS